MTLQSAREQVRVRSPEVAAARAGYEAASGRLRQTRSFSNPILAYSREQTSVETGTQQDIALVEQRFDVWTRGPRIQAAQLREDAARARLADAQALADFEVARVFASVGTADRRAELAATTAQHFGKAVDVMQKRMAEGDVSGYELRRLRLEAARYAALAAEASQERLAARTRLVQLGLPRNARLTPMAPNPNIALSTISSDSAVTLATTRYPEVEALRFEGLAAQAEVRAVRAERAPVPALSVGFKRERFAAGASGAQGFVAGLSFPLPLFDRGTGATAAAESDANRQVALLTALQQRLSADAIATREAVLSADEQIVTLQAQLGPEATAAITAAETAYREGEVTLLEWLDAVRAYYEAEASYANVLAESLVQRAALERLTGIPLIQ